MKGGEIELPGNDDDPDPFNVKHLTCYFWDHQGYCKWGKLCRYAHHQTGRVARAPVVKDNGRSVAGKNASADKPKYVRWQGIPVPEEIEHSRDRNRRVSECDQRRSRSPDRSSPKKRYCPSRSRPQHVYATDYDRNRAVLTYDAMAQGEGQIEVPSGSCKERNSINQCRNSPTDCDLLDYGDEPASKISKGEHYDRKTSDQDEARVLSPARLKKEYDPTRPHIGLEYNHSNVISSTAEKEQETSNYCLKAGPSTPQTTHTPLRAASMAISSPQHGRISAPSSIKISSAALNQLHTALIPKRSTSNPIKTPPTSNSPIVPIPIEELNELRTSRDQLENQYKEQTAFLITARSLLQSGSKVLTEEGQLAMDLCQRLQRGEEIDSNTVTNAWLSATTMLDEAQTFQVEVYQWAQSFPDETNRSPTPACISTQEHALSRDNPPTYYAEHQPPPPLHLQQFRDSYRIEAPTAYAPPQSTIAPDSLIYGHQNNRSWHTNSGYFPSHDQTQNNYPALQHNYGPPRGHPGPYHGLCSGLPPGVGGASQWGSQPTPALPAGACIGPSSGAHSGTHMASTASMGTGPMVYGPGGAGFF